jgi:serine-type D-Ala-D-Ala carboxypeptidase
MRDLSREKLDFLKTKCLQYVERGLVQGGVVCVRHKGDEVYHEAFGSFSFEPDSPAMPLDAVFPLSSITKSLTAAAVMILVEDGEMDLGHMVAAYFPKECHESWNQVTLGSLLTHTSGITDEEAGNTVKEGWLAEHRGEDFEGHEFDTEEYVLRGLKTPRLVPVDTAMRYCSFGYNILSLVVERVSDMDFDEFTRARIFTPLGMRDTHFRVPDSLFGRVVRRKPPEGQSVDLYSSARNLRRVNGSGSAYSTARDMAVFGQTILNGGIYDGVRILSPTGIRLMCTNRIPGVSAAYGSEFFKEASWGYGFNVRGYKCDHEGIYQTDRTVNHGGAGGVLLVMDFGYGLAFTIFTVPLTGNIRPLCNNIIFSAIEDVSVL